MVNLKYIMIFISFLIILFIGCAPKNKPQNKSLYKKNLCTELKYIESKTDKLNEHDTLFLSENKHDFNKLYYIIKRSQNLSDSIPLKILTLDSIKTRSIYNYFKYDLKENFTHLYAINYISYNNYDLILVIPFNINRFPLLIRKIYAIIVNQKNCDITDYLLIFNDNNVGIINPKEIKSFINKNKITINYVEGHSNYFSENERQKGRIGFQQKNYRVTNNGTFELIDIKNLIVIFNPINLQIKDTIILNK